MFQIRLQDRMFSCPYWLFILYFCLLWPGNTTGPNGKPNSLERLKFRILFKNIIDLMMLHPDFILNNQSFSDLKDLEAYCSSLLRQDEFSDAARFILEWLDQKEYIEVQTSGSTGKPQQIRIQKKHALNSAKATIAFFNFSPGNST